jgi:hypothetical protein
VLAAFRLLQPTNHLDAESVAWLERFLGEFKGTVVAVTHDRLEVATHSLQLPVSLDAVICHLPVRPACNLQYAVQLRGIQCFLTIFNRTQ